MPNLLAAILVDVGDRGPGPPHAYFERGGQRLGLRTPEVVPPAADTRLCMEAAPRWCSIQPPITNNALNARNAMSHDSGTAEVVADVMHAQDVVVHDALDHVEDPPAGQDEAEVERPAGGEPTFAPRLHAP